MAFLALGTIFFNKPKLYQLKILKQCIKCPKRAGCPAKRPAGQNGPNNKPDQYHQLIIKKIADCLSQRRLQDKHGQPSLKGPCRADILAVPKFSIAESIHNCQGQENYKKDQKKVFYIIEFLRNIKFPGGNFVEQLLDQAERTGPAANKAPENSTQNPHGPDYIQAKKILPVFQGNPYTCHQLLQ